jgi:hypothetical protein
MLSIFILVFSVSALVRLGISQWRAIWIATASQPLSDSLQLTAGIDGATIGAGDFKTLLQLCNKLSPDLKKTSPWLQEVSIYYRAVAKLEQIFKVKLPSISEWAKGEMQICSRYAAVVLDQNLSMNLDRQLAARGN